ncbi:MAG: hypothetical protein Q9211_003804 [Gyalolechia sp. 1 TL-2023]
MTLLCILSLPLISAPLARRSTRGPLDGDDPLAPDGPLASSIPTTEAASIPIPPTPSLTLSPERPLPNRPGNPSALPRKDLSFLLYPENFRPVPQTDIPSPFLPRSQYPSHDASLPALLRHGQLLPAATLAAITLTSSPSLAPSDIFSLLYTRLACLSVTSHTNIAAQESLILGDLNSRFYSTSSDFEKEGEEQEDCIIPWHLRVLATRLQALGAGEMRRCVQGYYDLAAYARARYKQSTTAESKDLWKGRLRDLGARTVNALIEMSDVSGAKRLLESLIRSTRAEKDIPSDRAREEAEAGQDEILKGWLAMLCLRMGDLDGARMWIDAGPTGDSDGAEQRSKRGVLDALYSMAEGKYEDAVVQWRDLLNGPHGVLGTHNLAVCLVYTGHVSEATGLLEDMVGQGHAFHALTFNLATIYELRTERAVERKVQMAERVAEGLREKEDVNKERVKGDFKL